jgi:hypothetical protein
MIFSIVPPRLKLDAGLGENAADSATGYNISARTPDG